MAGQPAQAIVVHEIQQAGTICRCKNGSPFSALAERGRAVGVRFCNMFFLWRPTAGRPRIRRTLRLEWSREPAAWGTPNNVIPQSSEYVERPHSAGDMRHRE
jgi:hypothetical protein